MTYIFDLNDGVHRIMFERLNDGVSVTVIDEDGNSVQRDEGDALEFWIPGAEFRQMAAAVAL